MSPLTNYVFANNRFFDDRHGEHYKVYNLCSERSYDPGKFHQRGKVLPWQPSRQLVYPIRPDCYVIIL